MQNDSVNKGVNNSVNFIFWVPEFGHPCVNTLLLIFFLESWTNADFLILEAETAFHSCNNVSNHQTCVVLLILHLKLILQWSEDITLSHRRTIFSLWQWSHLDYFTYLYKALFWFVKVLIWNQVFHNTTCFLPYYIHYYLIA